MSHLAMYVMGLPAGLTVTELTDEHVPDITALVRAKELAYFERSETNEPEILGTLKAPDLDGSRGTTGVWEDGELVAAMFAFNGLEHERGLFLDTFIAPYARNRQQLAQCLLRAGERYGETLSAPAGSFVKAESFAGDTEVETSLSDRGYERHRVYLRMRLDFEEPVGQPDPPAGLQVRGMTEQDWDQVHHVITEAFKDHYDSHPLPLDLFQQDMANETSDRNRWRLVFDGSQCVAVCIASHRFAPGGLGYVENLAVLREYRGRGIARFLLQDAFARDSADGFTGTSLHCDATNPTGATALYRSVGMTEDHNYVAWRTPLG